MLKFLRFGSQNRVLSKETSFKPIFNRNNYKKDENEKKYELGPIQN